MRAFTISILLFTAMTLEASAAPLCAIIFRPPPSPQQISSLFDDLARLTLQTDLEKVAGIKDSFLQTELKKKSLEIRQTLDISQSAVARELRPRLIELQKNIQAEEVRVHTERQSLGTLHPEFELKHTTIVPSFTRFVGISDQIQGRRRFLFTQLQSNKKYSDLIAFDPATSTTETIATSLSVAGIDSSKNQIVTFSVDNRTEKPSAELHFYSLTNLQASLPPVTLPWESSLIQRASRLPHRLDISTDGDHFLITSESGVYSSRLQKPDEVTENRQLTAIQDILYLENSNEFLSIHNTNVVLNRSVVQPRHLNLPTNGHMLRLIPLGENLTVAISSTDLMYVRMYVRNWKTETIYPHKMTNMVYFKEDLQTYVVGIENGKVVLKDLNSYSDSSLFDFSSIPQDAVAKSVYLSTNGKGLVVQGTRNNQTQLWFFENKWIAP